MTNTTTAVQCNETSLLQRGRDDEHGQRGGDGEEEEEEEEDAVDSLRQAAPVLHGLVLLLLALVPLQDPQKRQ